MMSLRRLMQVSVAVPPLCLDKNRSGIAMFGTVGFAHIAIQHEFMSFCDGSGGEIATPTCFLMYPAAAVTMQVLCPSADCKTEHCVEGV